MVLTGLLCFSLLSSHVFIFILKFFVAVGGGSSSKQRLPCRGNITAVVFPKRLKLSVISRTHSALTSFGMGLTYGFSLEPQKPC